MLLFVSAVFFELVEDVWLLVWLACCGAEVTAADELTGTGETTIVLMAKSVVVLAATPLSVSVEAVPYKIVDGSTITGMIIYSVDPASSVVVCVIVVV